MKYRNIKNGAIIDVSSEINDKNWELVAPGSSLVEKKEPIILEAPKKDEKPKKKATSSKKTTTIHPRTKKEG